MAAIEDAVYLTCIFPLLYSFRPRTKDKKKKKKKKRAKLVLKEDVDVDVWAGNFWENQMNKAEGK